jgi:hypothetical protein
VPLTHDEAIAIKKEVIAECKNIFVQIDDCNDKQEKVNSRFANDDKRIEKLMDKLEVWGKLLWVIASASLGALVVAFFELILK